MLCWTLPIFLIVAVIVDYLLSKGKPLITGTIHEKLSVIALAPIVAPVIEELAFRWMPLQWFGLWGMIGFTAIWILFHFKARYIAFYAIMGIYFCYLWYIGLGWLAILIHVLWNTGNCILILKYKEPSLAKWNFREPSIASVVWNSREIGLYRQWITKIQTFIFHR